MKAKKRLLTILILAAIVLTTAVALCGCDFDLFGTKINLAFNSELVLDNSYYQYTSQAITPKVELYHRDELVPEEYYTLTYSNNVQPGTATVIATGKDGGYYGEVSAEFYISYIYTFDVNGASQVDGELVQNVFTKDDLQVPTVSKLGYTFSHWSYDSKEVDFDDIESLPDNAEFVANYTLDVYKIKYVLDGGVNSPDNKATYSVEDAFELNAPTLSGKRFGGWFTDENFEHRITSLEGYYQDLTLYAKFGDYTYRLITYVVPDGATEVPYDLMLPETPLSYPQEQTAIIDGMQKRLVWYADSTCYYKYVFREMPDDDITVYARWEDALPTGFLDKADRFSAADVTLYSYQELVDYIDFVCFNNVHASLDSLPWVKVDYQSSISLEEQIKQALNVDCTYPRMTTVTHMRLEDGSAFKIALTSDVTQYEATESATSLDDLILQLGNLFALQSSGRGDYDEFPIDFVDKTYAVTTSDQLFYVLSHGYRPLPVQGSNAEDVYEAFRKIMRGICDDSMSDIEKVRAIYEWLVLNVQYDYAVVEMDLDNDEVYVYDAFFLEGVLRGVAVCDGLSKAFSVMCAIERIDCLRIAGQSILDGVGHAWNKVQLFGEWFVSDVTWGNSQSNSGDEYIRYQYFLFTDADRTEYIKQTYTQYVANTAFDFERYYSYRDIQVGSYDVDVDLYIESERELSYLFEYIILNFDEDALVRQSFEVILDYELLQSLLEKVAGDPNDNAPSRLYHDALAILQQRKPSARLPLQGGFRIYYSQYAYFLIFIF